MIGQIQGEAAAKTFSDFLYGQGICNELEHEQSDSWTVWVKSDDDRSQAAEYLRAFAQNPGDPVFQTATQHAANVRQMEKEDLARYRKRVRSGRKLFPSLKGYRFGPLTFALIFISVIVFAVMKLGTDPEAVRALWFTEYIHSGKFWERIVGVPEIRNGQLWRLFTPMFIHFHVLHILFNMMWLADLGSMIEARQSTWLLARLVAVIALGSNVVQYAVTGYPGFGGMSGVVYGLIGYIWMRGKFDPGCGLFLHKQTVITSLIWFFACLFGWLGHIANGAHAGGLVIGMAWGWLASLRKSRT
jgi:GlpG protein